MDNNQLSREKAIKFIGEVEEERIAFRESIFGDKVHEEMFDLILNRNSFSNEAMIEMIDFAAEKKGIFSKQ
jgi:hypothetical protein